MSTKISIIIPLYNASDTISRCIDSILAQDFVDFEVLLVNDGSKDNSLEVMRHQAERDRRIIAIDMPHGGVSAARNHALEKAKGEYVCFIDADDYVEPNYLSTMYEHKDCDLVICGYFVDWYKAEGNLNRREDCFLDQTGKFDINNSCDCIYELLANGRMHMNWNKLFKKSIIDEYQIRYVPIPVNEDYMFMIEYLLHAKTIYATDDVTYHWVRVENRKSGVNSLPDNLLDIYIEAHKKTFSLFHNKELVNKFMYYSYFFIVLKYLESYKTGALDKGSVFDKLNEEMKNPLVLSSFRSRSDASMGERLMNFLLMHRMYRIFILLRRVL